MTNSALIYADRTPLSLWHDGTVAGFCTLNRSFCEVEILVGNFVYNLPATISVRPSGGLRPPLHFLMVAAVIPTGENKRGRRDWRDAYLRLCMSRQVLKCLIPRTWIWTHPFHIYSCRCPLDRLSQFGCVVAVMPQLASVGFLASLSSAPLLDPF
jgi:hypothetical protein